MIYIKTYGCTFNKSDSQSMEYILQGDIAGTIEEADIVIFNTCGVKGQTESRVIKDIKEQIGNKRIIVAGCLPYINFDAIPLEVDAIIGPDQIMEIDSIVDDVRKGKKLIKIEQEVSTPKLMPQVHRGVTAIIPISLGCRGECAYCATRFARGGLRSYRPSEIIQNVKHLYQEGYKEFLLTSQDTGCYGFDIGTGLSALIENICAIEGDFRLRVGMMNPNHAMSQLDDLLESYKDKRIFKFLHLPVQSGSDKILSDMKRQYSIETFNYIVSEFRQRYPNIYLATDIIVGFPKETEEDFERSMDLIRRCRPDKVNITRYSARPNTAAAELEQFPDRIKKDRSRPLSRLVHRISYEINRTYVGNSLEALVVEKGKKGRMVGRLNNYKPVICDGKIGEFIKVKIRDATSTYLIADYL